jgi:hypothetical protein
MTDSVQQRGAPVAGLRQIQNDAKLVICRSSAYVGFSVCLAAASAYREQ